MGRDAMNLPRAVVVALVEDMCGFTLDAELLPASVSLNDIALNILLILDIPPSAPAKYLGPKNPARLEFECHPAAQDMAKMNLQKGLTHLLVRAANGDFENPCGGTLRHIVMTPADGDMTYCMAFEFIDGNGGEYMVTYARPPVFDWFGLVTSYHIRGPFLIRLAVEFGDRARAASKGESPPVSFTSLFFAARRIIGAMEKN